jgi:hypothetical protein
MERGEGPIRLAVLGTRGVAGAGKEAGGAMTIAARVLRREHDSEPQDTVEDCTLRKTERSSA